MCTNQFLEDDGYCTVCGSNHFRKQTRAQQEAAARKQQHARELGTQRSARIEEGITCNPRYNYARELVRKMAQGYGLDVKVVFHNRERSSCANWDSNVVTFGYQMLDYAYAHGQSEYASCAWVINGETLYGMQAIHHIAVHEFTHLLLAALDENYKRGPAHGNAFQNMLASLCAQFRYVEA